ncbi:biotin--[acetyl-CoA-carboxylase] ligase [Marinilactibacillus kalidii]|uniref:biotin--[acetyl-CoA-carboxylase] ligase n=1 Tax=Marinilactibacillus kalidii TaxID=2820274 RepID=UPI001ABECCB8
MHSSILKSKLLDYLNKQFPQYVTVDELSQACACSKEFTQVILNTIISDGMPLEFSKNTCRLSNPIMSKSAISANLHTKYFGQEILLLQSTPSTNDHIKENMNQFNHGSLLLAHEQTVGKGRLGRAWSSPAGKTVSMSLLLKPIDQTLDYALLTQLAAASMIKALSHYVAATIKWPNDIIVKKRKVSGILTEAEYAGNQLEGIILGIGINTNLDYENIPEDIRDKASSLKILSQMVDPNLIISRFLNYFEHDYQDWITTHRTEPFLEICRKHSALIGQDFWIMTDKEKRKASIDGLDKEGALVITYLDTLETVHLKSTHYSIRSETGYL